MEVLLDFCRSESLSEDGVRAIIERHGLTPNNHVENYDFFREACFNERVTEGIIRCLLEYFPDAASSTNHIGVSPLHRACNNKNATFDVIQLLIDAAPDTVRSVPIFGWAPLHILCYNKFVDEGTAMQILNLLMEKYPEAVRCADVAGNLPIHIASGARSPKFCSVLIEAYPGSVQIGNNRGTLPLHQASWKGNLATVKYLCNLYSDGILHTNTDGDHPIHSAIQGVCYIDKPVAAVEIVQFLLDIDANVKHQKHRGRSLLHYAACWRVEYKDPNVDAVLEVIKVLFDAHPEAIEDDEFTHVSHQRIQAFIKSELVYARQAKDHRLMTTPDDNGQLPLHLALQNNARLGSIKLLVKGNPSALRNTDNNFAMPLHIACQYHDSASVVQYLIDLHALTLEALDREGNTALHCACRGAKYETIALLLEKYDGPASKRNVQGKLPIDHLWESNQTIDRESVEYTGSVFRLLTAHPETVMNVGTDG